MTRSPSSSANQLSFDMTSSTQITSGEPSIPQPLNEVNTSLDEFRGFVEGDVLGDTQKAKEQKAKEDVASSIVVNTASSGEQPEALLSEILQKNNQEQKEITPPKPQAKKKVGEVLRDARLAANFAIEDIAAEIKIKPHHLLAIEESRFGDLPARTYAVGFVRAYAGVLNLDVDALVADCRREVSYSMPQKHARMIMPETAVAQPLPSSSLIVLTVALAFFLSAVGYVFTRDASVQSVATPPVAIAQPSVEQKAPEQKSVEQKTVPQVQPQTQPVDAPQAVTAQPATPTVVPQEEPATVDTGDVDTTHVSSGFLEKGLVGSAAPNTAGTATEDMAGKAPAPSRIKLKATDETTVQIFDASGRMVAERVINKGEAFYVPDKAGFTLATTNAGVLHMQIDGKEMQRLGETDEAMHNIPLNPESLLKYLQ